MCICMCALPLINVYFWFLVKMDAAERFISNFAPVLNSEIKIAVSFYHIH